MDALAGGPGRAVDASVKLYADVGDRWSVAAGYRTVEGGADVDEVYNFAWLHYAVASLLYRFWGFSSTSDNGRSMGRCEIPPDGIPATRSVAGFGANVSIAYLLFLSICCDARRPTPNPRAGNSGLTGRTLPE
jgi:hypothetical protein